MCIMLQKVSKQDRNTRVNWYEQFETRSESYKGWHKRFTSQLKARTRIDTRDL